MGRPKGSTSVFKKMEWGEQIHAIEMYLRQGIYPAYILEKESIPTRKRMKRDFRKMAESYTVINGILRKLKICRKFKDAPSESKCGKLLIPAYAGMYCFQSCMSVCVSVCSGYRRAVCIRLKCILVY